MGSLSAIFAETLHSIDTPSAQYLVEGVVHAVITPLPSALEPRPDELNTMHPSRFRLLLMHGGETREYVGTQQELVARLAILQPPIPTQRGWTMVEAVLDE